MRGPSLPSSTLPSSTSPLRSILRPLFMLPVFAALVAGIFGGLVRAGVTFPTSAGGAWIGAAVTAHAFLMICAFLGTVIGIERAVAVRHPFAFAAPAASALAGVLVLAGEPAAGRWAAVAAAGAFTAVNVVLRRRQREAHTLLLLVSALAWLVGCVLHALDVGVAGVVPMWFAFLVLTIAAERLEMTRLMRRRARAAQALNGILAFLVAGALLSTVTPVVGGVAWGASLAALAVWLLAFDIARRTVHAAGLSRYMAVCLLSGYFWLLVAGLAWMTAALGFGGRDVALHALALGFVFGMILGHAPVILPAVARVKVQFGGWFYLPLALLHGSLAVRFIAGGVSIPAIFSDAAVANAVAIATFVATMVGGAVVWRLRHAPVAAARPRADRLA